MENVIIMAETRIEYCNKIMKEDTTLMVKGQTG
jgi:hypothetical protein